MSALVLCVLAVLTLAGVGIMAWDKRCARAGAWRVPEKTIFLLAAIGGSLGVWVGMYLFRHKTKHGKFVLGIPLIIAVQTYLAYRML